MKLTLATILALALLSDSLAAGAVTKRLDNLHRYEVQFFARHGNPAEEQLVYVVFYEPDPSTNQGFVYLPGKGDEHARLNTRSILRDHGLEGHWFKATEAWRHAVDHLLPGR